MIPSLCDPFVLKSLCTPNTGPN